MLSDDDVSIEELVDQITVDAYGDEGYWSLLQAFDDHITFPLTATVLGTPVRVTKVDFDGDERRGLTATVQRDGHTSTVSLLDLDIGDHQVRLTRLTHAYRRWLGLDQ